jgi:3-phosphoglycerate kinase
VLLRVDFNVSFKEDGSIRSDERIKRALPTIQKLLSHGNKLVLMSHLGQPKGYDAKLTTEQVATRLEELVGKPVAFVPFADPFNVPLKTHDICMLDNIRFHAGEKKNDTEFAQKLATLADVYVNDAFAVCHRPDASVVGVAQLLPHFGGLLVKEEVEIIRKAIVNPPRPVVVVIAGAKISTKIGLIAKFLQFADSVLIGGAIANSFFKVKGWEIGKGAYEEDHLAEAKELLALGEHAEKLVLPVDARIGHEEMQDEPRVKSVEHIGSDDKMLDIGPATEKHYKDIIEAANTIIWNGPVGYFENPQFAKGTASIFESITENAQATSIVGGGDTLSAIKHLPDHDKITHISTGGGAMLELIEKGTLPGIEALEK